MSPISPPPPPSSSPWQRLYAAVLSRRARWQVARAERLPATVVSIGNLHWGGGGKTPLAIAVAAHLRDAGHRVAVLSRGYRRTSRGPLVVSRGAGPVVGVGEAGDEPFEIAAGLRDVAVVVGESRAAAGRLALSALAPPPDLLLLDDGFSHLALARDVDLLVFPADAPWGGGRLFPSGYLREPLTAAARADAVLATGGEPGDGATLAGELAAFGFRGPGFASRTVASAPRFVDDTEAPSDMPLFGFAAIADPARFLATANQLGLRLVGSRSFRDHLAYSVRELAELETAARRAGAAALLTTAKDRAKVVGRISLPLAVLPIAARPEGEFWSWLDRRLQNREA